MLSKCANPACSKQLVYLREGKIFRVEQLPGPQPTGRNDDPPRNSHRTEHFWLCGACSAKMTLVADKGLGVRVLPKQRTMAKAAS